MKVNTRQPSERRKNESCKLKDAGILSSNVNTMCFANKKVDKNGVLVSKSTFKAVERNGFVDGVKTYTP